MKVVAEKIISVFVCPCPYLSHQDTVNVCHALDLAYLLNRSDISAWVLASMRTR